MKKKIEYYIFLNWSLFILILISIPTKPSDEEGITIVDKIIHYILFFVFSYLLLNILSKYKLKKSYIFLLTFLISFLYALFCEFLQRYIPGRSPSFLDILSGILGVISVIIYNYAKEK